MKKLFREIPPGTTGAALIAEDPTVCFEYFLSENETEPNAENVSNDEDSWEKYRAVEAQDAIENGRYIVEYGSRLYLKKGRWYGPNSAYGINYFHSNSNYGSVDHLTMPNPGHWLAGIKVPRSGVLKKVRIIGKTNKANLDIHFLIVAQDKSFDTSSATNRILYSNTNPDYSPTSSYINTYVELEVEQSVEEGEVLALLANRSDNTGGTRYFYAPSIEFIFE